MRGKRAPLDARAGTGDVVFDHFTDTHARSALDTRLAHLRPVEIITPHALTLQTARLLNSYAPGEGCDPPRIEVRTARGTVGEEDA